MAVILAALPLGVSRMARAAPEDDWQETDQPPGSVQWFPGPGRADLGTEAQIRIPDGFIFAGALDVRKVLDELGDAASGSELGIVAPTDTAWFVIFQFDSIGYVRDDERESLDPDTILRNIRMSTAVANDERQHRGLPPIEVVGWEVRPHYDPATHNLEWAVRGRTNGYDVINYNVRLLGRDGVMKANLVLAPEALSDTLPKFRALLSGYEYKPGLRYADWGSGDRVAGYGLAALIAGGAAADKSSLFVRICEVLVVVIVIVSLMAWIKPIYSRIFGVQEDTESKPGSA